MTPADYASVIIPSGALVRFYIQEECEAWLAARQRQKPGLGNSARAQRVAYPPGAHRLFYIARWISESLTYRMPTLLWITEWGIWDTTENWHLYYKLREISGDRRLLHESPGHFFLGHETADLASYLQVAMLNGWGGYVLTQADYVNAFFSHDEYIDFFAKDPINIAPVRQEFCDNPSQSGT